MLASFLALFLTFVPAPAREVVSITPHGADVVVAFSDGALGIGSMVDLLRASRLDDVPLTILTLDDAMGPPTSYKLDYRSTAGTHHIETPCTSYGSIEECARAHKRAIDAMQQLFPKIPD